MSIFNRRVLKEQHVVLNCPVTTKCNHSFSKYAMTSSYLTNKIQTEIQTENRQRKLNSIISNTTYQEMTYSEWIQNELKKY